MTGKIYLMPFGASTKLAKALGLSAQTVRKVLNGHIEHVCSADTAERIYNAAPLYGGQITSRK